MLWHTHLAFGFLAGLALLPFVNYGNKYIFFAFVLLGALLPDIDKPESKIGSKLGIISKLIKGIFGHRGIVHTFWGMLVICGLFWLFASRQYGTALFIGFFSHLIIDGFTKKGVNILHPFSRFRIAGPMHTGKLGEFLLFAVIIALIALMLF